MCELCPQELASVIHLYYACGVALIWNDDGDDHLARHRVTIAQANEARPTPSVS